MYPKDWLALPRDLRARVAEKYNLSKSTYTNIVNNKVVSDGYSAKDLMDLTPEMVDAVIAESYSEQQALEQEAAPVEQAALEVTPEVLPEVAPEAPQSPVPAPTQE